MYQTKKKKGKLYNGNDDEKQSKKFGQQAKEANKLIERL